MSKMLLVDDAVALTDLFATAITSALAHDVVVISRLDDVATALQTDVPFDLALVDLSFPGQGGSGIDALVMINRTSPSTTLGIITQGDEWVADTLRDAWEILPIRTVISKSAPLDFQLSAIDRVLKHGTASIDPAIQPLIPANRNPWRTSETFSALVQHAGHAKLWLALMSADEPVTYRSISVATGLKLNTIKNYRAQLLPELALHGLDEPSLRDMREFARRCQAFLRPYLDAALERSRA